MLNALECQIVRQYTVAAAQRVNASANANAGKSGDAGAQVRPISRALFLQAAAKLCEHQSLSEGKKSRRQFYSFFDSPPKIIFNQ